MDIPMEYETIKNRFTGEVMCGGVSLKVVLSQHKKWVYGREGGKRAELIDADLRGANMSGANMSGANMSGAYMRDAYMSGANMSGANMSGANMSGANMSGANMSGAYMRGANMIGANMSGAYMRDAYMSGANMSDADMRDADMSGCPVKIENIHQKVYEAANMPGCLDMGNWHVCETTHCRAGWVVHLAGDGGKALEWAYGTPAAAAIIYMASDPKLEKIPNFYASNEDALDDMKRLAGLEAVKQ